MNEREPIQSYDDATVWYFEDSAETPENPERNGYETRHQVRHEGGVDIFPNWVVLTGAPGETWVPREYVEHISSL
jgi:hypothetical protein